MIELNIDNYCHNCEAFDPEIKHVNGTNDLNVVCKKRIWCKNAIKLYERSKKEEKNDD